MKPFVISESHLTQYRKFQWEYKAKEDYKPEKNGPGLTRAERLVTGTKRNDHSDPTA